MWGYFFWWNPFSTNMSKIYMMRFDTYYHGLICFEEKLSFTKRGKSQQLSIRWKDTEKPPTRWMYFVIGDGHCYLASQIRPPFLHVIVRNCGWSSGWNPLFEDVKYHSIPIAFKDMLNWCVQPCKQSLSTRYLKWESGCHKQMYIMYQAFFLKTRFQWFQESISKVHPFPWKSPKTLETHLNLYHLPSPNAMFHTLQGTNRQLTYPTFTQRNQKPTSSTVFLERDTPLKTNMYDIGNPHVQ